MDGGTFLLLLIGAVALWKLFAGFREGISEPSAQAAPHFSASGSFDIEIVGESRYQRALEAITGGRTHDGVHLVREATLIPETDNAADENAVRVEIEGMTVGYLGRDDAAELRAQLLRSNNPLRRINTQALIAGGWHRGPDDSGMFGVRLDLPTRPS